MKILVVEDDAIVVTIVTAVLGVAGHDLAPDDCMADKVEPELARLGITMRNTA